MARRCEPLRGGDVSHPQIHFGECVCRMYHSRTHNSAFDETVAEVAAQMPTRRSRRRMNAQDEVAVAGGWVVWVSAGVLTLMVDHLRLSQRISNCITHAMICE